MIAIFQNKVLKGSGAVMSEENKKKNEEESANITDEDNVEEQYEFGLNEDKRDEAEEEGQNLPEEDHEVADDAENVDYKDDKDK